MTVGFVSIIGAGPGDPDLWTVRAARRIAEADVVFYDALTDAAGLVGRTSARCFSVGKRAGERGVCQQTIHELLIRTARRGKHVVRLKSGDPFVFGRGAEESIALAAAGIPFEVIPGVSTAIGAPALAGIPVTHRGVASGLLVVSGHRPEILRGVLSGVRPGRLTVVVLMGIARRPDVVASLVECGWALETPTAIVTAAATTAQEVWTGRLDTLISAECGLLPGVIVVGDVVGVREIVGRFAGQTAATVGVRRGGS
jgi:uroporphyrin-III C-methyltransferase/precorrin-2 dehydrogenase/sirohydrochlorin ferrochelatase